MSNPHTSEAWLGAAWRGTPQHGMGIETSPGLPNGSAAAPGDAHCCLPKDDGPIWIFYTGVDARGNEITWENRGSALLEPTDEPGRLIGLWLAARIREHWQRVDVWHHVESDLDVPAGQIRDGRIVWAEQ